MNDKELFRYLQEIKVILNVLSNNDYDERMKNLEENLSKNQKMYATFLYQYVKLKLKIKLLNTISLGYYMRQNGSSVKYEQLRLEQTIETYDDRCYDNEIKIIGLRNEKEKN